MNEDTHTHTQKNEHTINSKLPVEMCSRNQFSIYCHHHHHHAVTLPSLIGKHVQEESHFPILLLI